MSLLVTVLVHDGIVMASDSRTTYINNNKVRYTDSTYKTFLMDGKIGISLCKDATINGRTIEYHINNFMIKYKGTNIQNVPNLLRNYFLMLNSTCDISFFVAGYDNGIPHIYRVFTQGGIETCPSNGPCSYWEGERDVPSRLFSNVYLKNGFNYTIHDEYELAIYDFSIQDAVDYAKFLIETTEKCMNFQRRNVTVGGPIDFLIIKPDCACWLKRKELKA